MQNLLENLSDSGLDFFVRLTGFFRIEAGFKHLPHVNLRIRFADLMVTWCNTRREVGSESASGKLRCNHTSR